MRILVVDDDAPNRKLLKKIVSKLGECDTAEGGREGLQRNRKRKKDIRAASGQNHHGNRGIGGKNGYGLCQKRL
jgi:CheY-like chemotaxis protein